MVARNILEQYLTKEKEVYKVGVCRKESFMRSGSYERLIIALPYCRIFLNLALLIGMVSSVTFAIVLHLCLRSQDSSFACTLAF